jgi:hypothetical protein
LTGPTGPTGYTGPTGRTVAVYGATTIAFSATNSLQTVTGDLGISSTTFPSLWIGGFLADTGSPWIVSIYGSVVSSSWNLTISVANFGTGGNYTIYYYYV